MRAAGGSQNPAVQLSSYVDRVPQLLDPKVVLEQLASSATPDATLRGFRPQHPQFEKLRQRYLALLRAAEAEDIVIIPKGPVLSPGQRHEHVALLRQRSKVPAPAANGDAPRTRFTTMRSQTRCGNSRPRRGFLRTARSATARARR